MMNTQMKAVAAICCFLIGGCVSTTTGSLQPEVNDNDAAELNLALGVQYYENGAYELSRDRLELALELNPRMAVAHSQLGMTYEALDVPRLASEHYEKSIRIAPRDFNIQNRYAVYQCRQKDYEKAAAHFDKAIAHPENDDSFVTMTNAGLCMSQKPDLARAEQYFRAALERKPGHGDALLQLCLMKFSQKDFMGARAFLQRFMSTNQTTAGVLYLAARIEDMLGNDRGRTEYENQLIRQFPTSNEARKVLGSG